MYTLCTYYLCVFVYSCKYICVCFVCIHVQLPYDIYFCLQFVALIMFLAYSPSVTVRVVCLDANLNSNRKLLVENRS